MANKNKLTVRKHEQSKPVSKVMDSIEQGDLERLNLLIPGHLKHQFNLACTKNKTKMTPVIVELMAKYVEENG